MNSGIFDSVVVGWIIGSLKDEEGGIGTVETAENFVGEDWIWMGIFDVKRGEFWYSFS